MNNLSLRVRLILGFAVPMIFLLIAVYVGVSSNEAIRSAFTTVSEVNVPIVNLLQEQKFIASRLISSTNEVVLDHVLEASEAAEADEVVTEADDTDAAESGEEGEENEREQVETSLQAFDAALVTYRQFVVDNMPEEIPYLESVETASAALIEISEAVLQLLDSGASIDEIREAREEFEDAEGDFLAAIDTATDFEADQLMARQSEVNATVQQSLSISVGVIVFALAASGIIGFYLISSITRPLGKLIVTAANLRNNDLSARANLTGADELGMMGRTFDEMAEALQERQDQLQQVNEALAENLIEVEHARADAEHSSQVKSAFLASMSHELRTPLNAIINFSKFVVKGVMGPVNSEQEDALTNVIDSAKHLLSLINDVLDISKIESGSLNLFIEDDVDLNAIVSSAAATARSLLVDKPEVALELKIADNLPIMTGDRQRISQIILNIISNACKFTETGQITIRAEADQDEVLIAVEDTGPGIALEEFEAVFDAFGQTETGLRQAGGTGLGMPISRRLAEAHGGRMWLESEPGKGSTFYVSLPVHTETLIPA